MSSRILTFYPQSSHVANNNQTEFKYIQEYSLFLSIRERKYGYSSFNEVFLQAIDTDIPNKVMNTLKSKPKALNSI
ncbi:hypothetical protein BC008_15245 [Mastigocoleus testarum BC008]|uniref:Uncharacterized protein n=1 Tax=Mastigocoleus testarum BC008 TaxID=371196 RepID=A0A0V7ZGY1_9CYAN|nr:hypothetical protein BC008_15245 [Mastigocoleus testarum BC008]